MISHRVVHESHIALGNYVRVIGGRDIHRTGHAIEIVGSMVQIREALGRRDAPIQPQTAALITQANPGSVSVSFVHLRLVFVLMYTKFLAYINQVEVIRSGYHSGERSPEQLRCWRSDDGFMVNDFIRVLRGDRVGQEGVITRFLEDYRVEVYRTADHPDISFKPESADDITKSNDRLDDLQSSAEKFEVLLCDVHVGDRIQMYDTVQVHHGKQKLAGVVRSQRPFGYIHIADTAAADDKASSYSFLCQIKLIIPSL